jgi:dihydroxy-acid dehydratase
LISEDELEKRKQELIKNGGYNAPESQSPWQQYFREMVQPFSEGMVLKDAPNYKSIARTKGVPRDNH